MVLGLITTKKGGMETREELERRISDASSYIRLERLGLSPQCGFASSIIGNRLAFSDQRRKLELLLETARSIWD